MGKRALKPPTFDLLPGGLHDLTIKLGISTTARGSGSVCLTLAGGTPKISYVKHGFAKLPWEKLGRRKPARDGEPRGEEEHKVRAARDIDTSKHLGEEQDRLRRKDASNRRVHKLMELALSNCKGLLAFRPEG